MFDKVRKTTLAVPGLALFKGVIPTIASLAFIVYISYLGWMSLGPEKPVPDEKRQAIAVKGVESVREQLRKERGGINSAVLLHFANDPTDHITDSLRRVINLSGVLTLEDRSFTEKVRNKLNLVNPGCATREEALKSARESGAEGVLWGVVERFESFPEGAAVKGRWELLEIKSGKVIISGVIDEDSSRKVPVAVKKAAGDRAGSADKLVSALPLWLRVAGFMLCVLMVPVVSFAFIRSQVAKDSNKGNALILGVLTLIDMLLALLLVSGSFATPTGVFLFLGGSAAGFFYNAAMMRFARKLEK